MADGPIHKLIMPQPERGNLSELILCWKERRVSVPDRITNTKFATNINNVTCQKCLDVWKSGIYV